MSNYLAVATVTAAIRQILADIDVSGVDITVKPPDAMQSPDKDSLNLFLYQVTSNIGYKNSDLPTRNKKGELVNKPQLALNLHYLLTAYTTNNNELQAQKILASAMILLHENSVITRDTILKTIESENDVLATSNLASQVELIKLVPQPLSTEEMTKLWSSFFQINYRLSVAYQATVVLLESKQEPKPTLPVRDRFLYVAPFRQIVIDKVEPQILEYSVNAKLAINGRNLKANKVLIRIANLQVEVTQPADVTNSQISVTIPENSTAGIKSVRVIHPLIFGSPETEHSGYESNVAAFVLAPRITKIDPSSVSPESDLTLEFEPAITPKQKVAVLIGDYTFPITRDPKSDPIKKLSVTIPKDFPHKTYLVRLRVDGAESLPEVDSDPNSATYGVFRGPTMTVS